MSPIARCPACVKTYDECTCPSACAICGCVMQHTTTQHERALAALENEEEEP